MRPPGLLIQADALDPLPYGEGVFHCVVTSPPYWGLRKYAGEQGEEPLGLESDYRQHIDRIVSVMREVRRVLRDDGVCWFNYGDAYTGGGRGKSDTPKQASNRGHGETGPGYRGMEAGNLMLLPHRIAIALQDDGWVVRQDAVWAKPNPMPESVNGQRWEWERVEKARIVGGGAQNANVGSFSAMSGGKDKVEWEYGPDFLLRRGSWRHTRAHEYVFMLTKGMGYWSDAEAVREAQTWQGGAGNRNYRAWSDRGREHEGQRNEPNPAGRNPRSVLTVPTYSYRDAHYATFPPKLIAPLIMAACPRWACPVCGAGWSPVVERGYEGSDWGRKNATSERYDARYGGNRPYKSVNSQGSNLTIANNVLGYRPTCKHEHTQEEAVPGVVFDPFVGSGTTVQVARELGRRGVGQDISREYLSEQASVRAGVGRKPLEKQIEGLPLFGGDDDV